MVRTKKDKEPGQALYRKGIGMMRLKDGRVVKNGDQFWAYPDDIPNAFRKGVTEIQPAEEKDVEKESTPVEKKFKPEMTSPGWYDVINTETDKAINENKLRKDEATEMANSLNEG